MTNDTLELLETIACERQQALDRTDPEQRALEQEYRTQWAAFLQEHRHNRRLRQEVLRLLDLRGALEDGHDRIHFRLGLQMGLELGGIHILRED